VWQHDMVADVDRDNVVQLGSNVAKPKREKSVRGMHEKCDLRCFQASERQVRVWTRTMRRSPCITVLACGVT
jgi:hypothetical protein